MVIIIFGGLGVDFDDGSENVVGAIFLLRVDVVGENLMGLNGTKILLIFIEVAFYREGVLWKIFGDEASGNSRP